MPIVALGRTRTPGGTSPGWRPGAGPPARPASAHGGPCPRRRPPWPGPSCGPRPEGPCRGGPWPSASCSNPQRALAGGRVIIGEFMWDTMSALHGIGRVWHAPPRRLANNQRTVTLYYRDRHCTYIFCVTPMAHSLDCTADLTNPCDLSTCVAGR